MSGKTIEKVVNDHLCMGCGTCISFCPKNALNLSNDNKKGIYIPVLDKELCNNCGTCIKICPGHEVDFKELNKEIFGKNPESILLGNYLNFYLGYSKDENIRYESSSGGLLTQSLIYAIENGFIDGALVTRMKKDSPFEPEPFIARTREEIIEAEGSKYCPVPANIGLKEILDSKDGERFAVVGLPCHIHGIRKSEQFNEKLKEKIVLRLGIICSKCPNFSATDYILWKYDIGKEKVKSISYRGRGYPGGMEIELKDGNIISLDMWDYYDTSFGQFFAPIRCRLCADYTSEFADISFGDMLSEENVNEDKIGTSSVITRTNNGDDFLNKVSSVDLFPRNINQVVNVAEGAIIFKKTDLKIRGLFASKKPFYNVNLLKTSKAYIYSFLFMIIYKIGSFLASKRYLWGLMRRYAHLIKLSDNLISKK